MNTHETVDEVIEERARQEELCRSGKFPWTCAHRTHRGDMILNAEKLAVLAEEFGEVSREVTEEMIALDKSRTREGRTWDEGAADKARVIRDRLRTELIQVAAVAVAWAESLGGR